MFKTTLTALAILAGLACDPVHATGFGNPANVPSQWPEKGAFTCLARDTKSITSTRDAQNLEVPTVVDDGVRGR